MSFIHFFLMLALLVWCHVVIATHGTTHDMAHQHLKTQYNKDNAADED